MHRNTFFFILFLAVFAAIVAGINITRYVSPQTTTEPTQTASQITPALTPQKQTQWVTKETCDISFSHPAIFQSIDIGTGGITLVNTNNENEFLIILCQNTPPVNKNMNATEKKQIGTVSAQLYAEQQENQRKTLVFQHPSSKKYLYISGTIESFDEVLMSIQIK